MNANKHALGEHAKRAPAKPTPWVDPDDAPDLSHANLDDAIWRIGQREVSAAEGMAAFTAQARRGRPTGSTKQDAKQAVTIRYSPDVLEAFRASGPGWQARMNDALRDWLHTHSSV